MYFFIAFLLLLLVLLIPSDNRFLFYIKTVLTILLLISIIIIIFDLLIYTSSRYRLIKKDSDSDNLNKPVTTAQPTTPTTPITTTTAAPITSSNKTINVPAPIPDANVIQYPLCTSGINPPCYQYSTTTTSFTPSPITTTPSPNSI